MGVTILPTSSSRRLGSHALVSSSLLFHSGSAAAAAAASDSSPPSFSSSIWKDMMSSPIPSLSFPLLFLKSMVASSTRKSCARS